jgi:hypothetical protein
MPDDILQTAASAAVPEGASAAAREELSIFDNVQYVFVNYAEVALSDTNVRIALGDDLPSGPIQPKVGLIMPVEYARLLCESLTAALNPPG